MKQAWTKKLRSVVGCAAANDSLKGLEPPVRSKVKRGTPTTIVGLVISIGASNLLLPVDERASAANEPMNSRVPGATETEGGSTNSMEPEAVKSLSPTVVLAPPLNYQVRAGDTLSAIALLHGVSLKELVNANHLTTPDWLQINQRLTIPAHYNRTAGQGAILGRQNVKPMMTNNAVIDAQLETPKTVFMVPDLPSAVSEPTVVVPSVSQLYLVKAGDTLSVIALKQNIPLKKLISANNLTAPDQLQIKQRLTIPAHYSSAVSQTTVIKHPIHPQATASNVGSATLKTGLSIFSWREPVTKSQQSTSVLAQAKTPPSSVAQGIGGGSDDEGLTTFNKSQLTQSRAVTEELQSNPYAQNLQADIRMLQQKYHTQQTVSQVIPSSETGTVAAPLQVSIPGKAVTLKEGINSQFNLKLPANQPTNPEVRSKRKFEALKLAIQKPLTVRAEVRVPPKTRSSTLPIGIDAFKSPQSLKERQISPDLPPLAVVDTYLSKPFDNSVYFKGYIWPARGALTSGYGWRWGRMHKGIDIAAPIGTPVVAAAQGVVVKAGWNPSGYGKLVDIKHADGTFTRYAHNNRILVQPGQEVEQGQLISEMGSTGRSTGPHLHFEMHPAGKGAVNPVAFLQRQ